jgi:hypothetical protein
MSSPSHFGRVFTLTALAIYCSILSKSQASADVYSQIKAQPSTIRWCLPEAGDDPAHIISGRCSVYRECLSDLNLDETVDTNLKAQITAEQVESLRRCHQALFNAARVNPQIKGSAATQRWLQHSVHQGTEAKSFPIPGMTSEPR